MKPPDLHQSLQWLKKFGVSLLPMLLCIAFASCATLRKATAPAPDAPASEQAAEAATEEESPVKKKKSRPWRDYIFFWKLFQKDPVPAATPLGTAGKVFFINAPANFIVVEASGGVRLHEGAEVGMISEGTIVASFRITPDQRPPFYVAEIVTGTPVRGERLVLLD